ncbi:MAG: serine/threonine dehydratase [Proteobacteria bacterium]|nr:serine/threonine dehydratase [Pseudomonadota bacterium]MDG4544520.1 serine/threonine dehydratase [Rickettsiales bacterium]
MRQSPFKVEGLQKIGAFKIRGALNTILSLKEEGKLPKEIVTFSSGNHAQAVALAGSLFDIGVTVFMTEAASKIKKQATLGYGAKVITTKTRAEAEQRTFEAQAEGAYFIHPFDDDRIIAGQGTSCFEALSSGLQPDAIFATCGGGGWLSGSYLAKELLKPNTKIFAGEPANANDATRSYNSGKIVKYDESPKTIADGATSLCVSNRTFQYLQKLDGFFEATEEEIIYWTQLLTHLLKISVEPTSAVAMAVTYKWLKTQTKKQNVLVLLSGGNVSPDTQKIIWQESCLGNVPC